MLVLDLKHLDEKERDKILNVLKRNADLQRKDSQRLVDLKAEIKRLKVRGALRPGADGDRSCRRCRKRLGYIFDTGAICPRCLAKVCKECRHYYLPTNGRGAAYVAQRDYPESAEFKGSPILNGHIDDEEENPTFANGVGEAKLQNDHTFLRDLTRRFSHFGSEQFGGDYDSSNARNFDRQPSFDRWVCVLCYKLMDYACRSGEWFYQNPTNRKYSLHSSNPTPNIDLDNLTNVDPTRLGGISFTLDHDSINDLHLVKTSQPVNHSNSRGDDPISSLTPVQEFAKPQGEDILYTNYGDDEKMDDEDAKMGVKARHSVIIENRPLSDIEETRSVPDILEDKKGIGDSIKAIHSDTMLYRGTTGSLDAEGSLLNSFSFGFGTKRKSFDSESGSAIEQPRRRIWWWEDGSAKGCELNEENPYSTAIGLSAKVQSNPENLVSSKFPAGITMNSMGIFTLDYDYFTHMLFSNTIPRLEQGVVKMLEPPSMVLKPDITKASDCPSISQPYLMKAASYSHPIRPLCTTKMPVNSESLDIEVITASKPDSKTKPSSHVIIPLRYRKKLSSISSSPIKYLKHSLVKNFNEKLALPARARKVSLVRLVAFNKLYKSSDEPVSKNVSSVSESTTNSRSAKIPYRFSLPEPLYKIFENDSGDDNSGGDFGIMTHNNSQPSHLSKTHKARGNQRKLSDSIISMKNKLNLSIQNATSRCVSSIKQLINMPQATEQFQVGHCVPRTNLFSRILFPSHRSKTSISGGSKEEFGIISEKSSDTRDTSSPEPVEGIYLNKKSEENYLRTRFNTAAKDSNYESSLESGNSSATTTGKRSTLRKQIAVDQGNQFDKTRRAKSEMSALRQISTASSVKSSHSTDTDIELAFASLAPTRASLASPSPRSSDKRLSHSGVYPVTTVHNSVVLGGIDHTSGMISSPPSTAHHRMTTDSLTSGEQDILPRFDSFAHSRDRTLELAFGEISLALHYKLTHKSLEVHILECRGLVVSPSSQEFPSNHSGHSIGGRISTMSPPSTSSRHHFAGAISPFAAFKFKRAIGSDSLKARKRRHTTSSSAVNSTASPHRTDDISVQSEMSKTNLLIPQATVKASSSTSHLMSVLLSKTSPLPHRRRNKMADKYDDQGDSKIKLSEAHTSPRSDVSATRVVPVYSESASDYQDSDKKLPTTSASNIGRESTSKTIPSVNVTPVSSTVFPHHDRSHSTLLTSDVNETQHSMSVPNPYVKVYLLPDRTRASKRKTRVKHKTGNPIYNEMLEYRPVYIDELRNRSLEIGVYHREIFGKNVFLGQVIINLNNYKFQDLLPKWYKLKNRENSINL
ncbi:unnamed protein product [Gordionus sp. m RMFG-2023]|uniref:uncharacterized protein LOC135925373 isoform X2 n=1 Tax=Gordionus sp. m RMFG-2023 TaxID=3053472 RepID=UPI0030E48ADE